MMQRVVQSFSLGARAQHKVRAKLVFQDKAGSCKDRQRVSVRLRSTAAIPHNITDEEFSKPVGWDSAKLYSEVPGPKPLPFIGNIWRYMPVIGEFHKVNTNDFYETMCARYGPISKLSGLPGKPDIIIMNDPDMVAQIFRNEGPWPLRRGIDSLSYYYTHIRKGYAVSLTVSQGKEWQEFRTSINQVMMQPRNTKQYVEPIDRVSQEFIDRMRSIRNSNMEMPPNFFDEIAKWALESIAFVALDTRLGVLGNLDPDSEGSKMVQTVHDIFDGMYKLDFLPSAWKIVPTRDYRMFVRSLDYFTDVSAKYVNKAVERLKSIPRSEVEERNYSVLENLLLRTEDPQRAVSMALDMLFAGIDTTATVVATVMYQLANNPDKQKKLQEELDRVMPDRNQTLTKQQLEEMRYLRGCIKETMRIMPIIIGNNRSTVKDMVVGGYQIPKGTMTITSGKVISCNEKYFPRPEEFLPERWLPGAEDLKSKHPFAFLPFGFGPRMCAGKRFADLEIETITAKTFRNYFLEWNKPPVRTNFKLVLSFEDPLCFTVKDRL